MDTYVATGFVDRGELKLRNRQQVQAAMRKFRDGEVTVTIERKHATRSLAQNRYYFGVVLRLLSEHTGYTVDELHEYFKQEFLPKELAIVDGNGEVRGSRVIGGSTRALNKNQFTEYIESIRQRAGELDVFIPDPDPEYANAKDAA